MQTPRFSGQPCSAGDFVFVRTCSRPERTNCANVGTVLPQTSNFFLQSAAYTATRTHYCFNRERPNVQRPRRTDKKLRTRTQLGLSPHLVKAERLTRLFGAGAPFRPLFQPRSIHPSSGAEDLPFQPQGPKTPETKGEYRQKQAGCQMVIRAKTVPRWNQFPCGSNRKIRWQIQLAK